MVARPCGSKIVVARSLAVVLATSLVFGLGRVRAAPGDIFSQPAPVIGADPPKAAELRTGDASVSTQTGALSYSYRIQVPPGRNGMAPSLALTYSSQAPIYGGIAAGWSLPIGMIRQDTSRGRMAAGTDNRFLVGESRLVEVTEPKAADVSRTYRIANGDTSYTRYERLIAGATARWRARATDGSISLFGEPSLTSGCVMVGDGYAPLTRTIDLFGNEVAYQWESGIANECRIAKITWGQNANAGMSNPFAQVVFTWERSPTCAGAGDFNGAQRDYRTGQLIYSGASRLLAITSTAFPPGSPGTPDHTRTITLGYTLDDQECTANHSPVRLLASIQETAFGTDSPSVALPAVTFEYGDPAVNLTAAGTGSSPWFNLGWGKRFNDDRSPTIESMLLDVDGDGLLDRVENTSTAATTGECKATWTRNLGPTTPGAMPNFGGSFPSLTLPRLPWRGTAPPPPQGPPEEGATADTSELGLNRESCALNGQFTAYQNSFNNGGNLCHNLTSCAAASSPDNPSLYCFPGGTECPPDADEQASPYRTQFAYRWLDMDADGLVDLVAAIHGDIDYYDPALGLYNGTPHPEGTFTWPACPGSLDRCKNVSAQCASSARSCPAGQPCTFNQSVFDSCLTTAQAIGCHELIRDIPPPGAPPPGGGGGSGTSTRRAPYTRCEGLYPWMIYKNLGNGAFETDPVIKYQPVPLESDTGDSNLSGRGVSSQRHGVFDFDGDGILDAVARPRPDSGYAPYWWFVWLGDGTGGFGPTRYLFRTRDDPDNAISMTSPIPSGDVREIYGLLDLNGDGLSDHWQFDISTLGANVAWNLGKTTFELFGVNGSVPTGGLDTFPGLAPSNETTRTITEQDNNTNGHPILAGYTVTKHRMLDVDQDGRIDLVRWDSSPLVHWNAGGQFIQAGVAYPGNTNGLQRLITATSGVPLTWELDGDLIDLDGDGLPESVKFDPSSGFSRYLRPNGPPPRLLSAVHNGRGGHAAVTYAQMHDSDVVEQNPSLTWPDGRPKATPRTQWVVHSLTSTDQFSNTTSTTTYKYRNPRHGADDEGRYAFRGFEEVITTSPSLAETVQRYAYTPDWSGRLVETVTKRSSAPASVQAMSTTTWTARTLFGGAVTTYHPTMVQQRTCSNANSTEALCIATPAAFTQTESTLLDFPLAGQKLLALETGTLLKQQTGAADGDRQTLRTFDTLIDTVNYRVRPRTVIKEHRVAGTMTLFAKSEQTWDPTLAVNLTNEVWFDGNDANRAISRTVYDMTTGNVLERWKPVQNAASSVRTVLTYDPRKLFVATETNEVGHQRDYQYEYGTGTLLQTDGPDIRTCTTCPPPTPSEPLKEQTKIRVDGLGRTIEQWETSSDDGSKFLLYQTQLTSYVDNILGSSAPTSSTHQVRQKTAANSTWTNVKTELDGHGRPLRTIELVQGTAPNDAITSFVYANDGTLQSVSVPDPTQNNTSTVSYRYGFDSLGRATSIRRPDSTVQTSQSGVDIAYDGVTKTVTEVTGAAGGLAASTITLTDSFGRLIEVREQTSASPVTMATTHYTFGPDDNVISVVDPEGVTTQLVHDFGGRRTQILRHGRTWRYEYDQNGNLTSEQVPGSPNPPITDPEYTTTIAYDALDRPASKLVGTRGLSAADQALFAGRTEVFTWDVGGNMKGHLRTWASYAPSTGSPTFTRELRRTDGDQNSYSEVGFFSLAGLTATRGTNTKFNLANLPTETRYYDQVAPSNQVTYGTIQYDARNLPSQITFNNVNSGQPLQSLGVQTRNVAGLVTKRRSNFTGSADYVESNWSYDKLGRVVDQVVQKTPGPVQIARQQLTYLGNDNPSTLAHTIGASAKSFAYGYDQRHQITSANETTTPGYFTSTYSYGLAGRFTGANLAQTAPGPGSELVPRNVDYQYGDADPERVTALTLAGTSTRFASYQYDEAGNMIWRCYGASFSPCTGESIEFLYDGKDQLRRATKKLNGVVQGSEEYWYDHEGARVAIVRRGANGVKTETLSFLGDTEAHYGSTDTLDFIYSHLSLGTPIARVKRTSTGIELEHQFHGLGSHTLVSVTSPDAIHSGFYHSPFGELIESTGPGTISLLRRFNDKYQDQLTTLHYYGARYYDSILHSWTQSDPVYSRFPDAAAVFPRRTSLYHFSLGNPLRYFDPDGRDPGKAAPVAMPESPITLRQRSLALRIEDSDWTVKFSSEAITPGLDIDTSGCSGGWSGKWCDDQEDDDDLLLGLGIGTGMNPGGGPMHLVAVFGSVGHAILRQNREGNCASKPTSDCGPGPHTGRDALTILQGLTGIMSMRPGKSGGSASSRTLPHLINPKDLPRPNGMTNAEFGRLIGWTNSRSFSKNMSDTRSLIQGLPGRIESLQRAGVTKSMSQVWADYYLQESRGVRTNANALPRHLLMQTIANMIP